MLCPKCSTDAHVQKRGFFSKKSSPNTKTRRFYCKRCKVWFSTPTGSLFFREKKPELDREIYLLVNSGVSQRRIARLLQTTQTTVARKIVKLAAFAERHQEKIANSCPKSVSQIVFDDMETYEHTKCKPLSITVAVEEGSRLIIAAAVTQMPAKGKLAAIAKKRYGFRGDHRKKGLAKALKTVAKVATEKPLIKSDMCPRYPGAVRKYLPNAVHKVYKSRRACVAGLGEMKKGGFDPLFSLNHTCAMYRDNLKRLSRKTWCTTKRPDRLQCLVTLYATAHNDYIRLELYRKRRGTARERTFLEITNGRA